jgi:urease accessory protein
MAAAISHLLLTDGRFPAGGYAHSGGLEAAVEAGLEVGEVPLFLAGRLRGVAAAEAGLAVLAARSARVEGFDELLSLEAEANARCASPPLRTASSRLGAQLLRSAAVVWPLASVIQGYRDRSASTPRPVAFGVVAAAASLDDLELAQAYLYEDASSVTTAAVRLLPLDSALAVRWLLDAGPLVQELAADAASADGDARSLRGGFAPLLELRSLKHAARQGRLFAS